MDVQKGLQQSGSVLFCVMNNIVINKFLPTVISSCFQNNSCELTGIAWSEIFLHQRYHSNQDQHLYGKSEEEVTEAALHCHSMLITGKSNLFSKQTVQKSIEDCLAYKIDKNISNRDWNDLVEFFNCEERTVYHLNEKKVEKQKEHPFISWTATHKGSEVNLIEYLTWFLPKHPEITKVDLKLSFDSALKSPDRFHQIIVYIGNESNETSESYNGC